MRTAITACALALVAALGSPARGDTDVGVIVTGEGSMLPQLTAQIEDWLSRHGHRLVPSPLPPEAITAVVDCFVLEDQGCARSIVETRAKSSSMVYARVDTKNNASNGTRDVTLTAYWFDKGHDAVAERKTCERCTDQSLRTTADEVMKKLLGGGDGHVKLTSTPAGARITIDGEPIGVTPLDWDLPAGKHTIQMDKAGWTPASRDVVVVGNRTDVVAFELTQPEPADRGGTRYPRWIPGVVIGGGLVAIAGGSLMSYTAPEPSPGQQRNKYIYSGPGIAIAVAGGAVVGVGIYLWFRNKPSAPTIALLPGGGVAGWTASF